MKTNPKSLTYEKVLNSAIEMFGDRDKATSWWISKQEQLGGKSPYELVRDGKGRYVMKMIERCS